MRKLICFVLLALCVFSVSAVSAEEPVTVTLKGTSFSVPADTEYIDMGDTYVKDYDAFIDFLSALPNVKSVDMFTTKIRKKNIDRLAEAFPDITFGWTMEIAAKDGSHLIRTDATAFSTLHNNRSVHHTSNDFSILKYCKNLLALDIGHNGVDDLSFLYDLPNLKVLIVACNAITDITPVGSLKDLEYVELFKNKITDISPLANCTALLDLNICFNRISDWSPIYDLPVLQRLWLYNSNNYSDSSPVPKDVVSALIEHHPDTHVDSTHYSTLGTWRDPGTHYDTIFEMFKTGVYIPFDPEAKR